MQVVSLFRIRIHELDCGVRWNDGNVTGIVSSRSETF